MRGLWEQLRIWYCLDYQKRGFVWIFPAITLAPSSIWLKIQMWLTKVYIAHVPCSPAARILSVAISIYRAQSFYPQLLIASAFPFISLDGFFCLVCKWIQVLSQHTGPSFVCPVALALGQAPPTALSVPRAPSWQSPFDLGTQLQLI